MDFLDPKKRRAHRKQLFIGYALMAVALGTATWLLVNVALGFGYDRKTHSVIQYGLIYVDAHPEAATIYLNGQNQGGTDRKLNVPAAAYTLKLQRKGYRTWQHGINLGGGGVENFVYPFMFPEKLQTTDADLFTVSPGFASESLDKRWFIAQQGNSLTNFEEVDLVSANNATSVINLEEGLFSAAEGEHQLEAIEWASDNKHLLIKHTFNSGTTSEYVMLDREEPTSSINLSRTFPDLAIYEMVLRDKRFDRFYARTLDNTLVSLDTKTKQVVTVLANVVSFKPFAADTLLYTTAEGAPAGKLVVKLKDGKTTYSLRELPTNTNYLLDLAEFNGSMYVAAGASSEGRVYEYKDPIDSLKQAPNKFPTPIALLKVDNPEFMKFSQNTRFLAVQSKSKFAAYDAETDRQFRYDLGITLDPPTKFQWMDGHRLVLLSGGKVVISDFDGNNVQTLSAANAGYPVFFDRDYKRMYTIAPSISVKDHPALTSTALVVK